MRADCKEDEVRTLERCLAEAHARIKALRVTFSFVPYEVLAACDAESAGWFIENLMRSVDELESSVRTHNQLKKANIRTIAELVQRNEAAMLKSKEFSKKAIKEIKELLAAVHLALDTRLDEGLLAEIAAREQRWRTRAF